MNKYFLKKWAKDKENHSLDHLGTVAEREDLFPQAGMHEMLSKKKYH